MTRIYKIDVSDIDQLTTPVYAEFTNGSTVLLGAFLYEEDAELFFEAAVAGIRRMPQNHDDEECRHWWSRENDRERADVEREFRRTGGKGDRHPADDPNLFEAWDNRKRE